MACDIQTLINNNPCFLQLSDREQLVVIASLLCNISASGGGGGSGSVTSFSAGNLSPLFTTAVATPTTTPALTFALTNAAANTVLANATTSSAAPGFTSSPACVRFIEVVSAIGGTSIDWSVASMFTFTVSANVTFTFANLTAGQTIKVKILGDASHTVTWPTTLWPGGVAPVQTLSKTDVYTFISFDGTTVEGSAVQNMS